MAQYIVPSHRLDKLENKMKHFFMTCCTALFISACSEQILDFHDANISNGQIYAAGANKPFSGKVTNIPYVQLPIREVTTALEMYSVKSNNESLLKSIHMGGIAAFKNDNTQNFPILCDVQTQNGNLDGKAICYTNNTEHLEVLSFQFENGILTGKLKINDLNNDKTKTSQVFDGNFVNGKLDGKFSISSKNTGNVIYSGHISSEKLDGEQLSYSADGTLFAKENYIANRLIDKTVYDPNTKQPIGTITYDEEMNPMNGILVEYRAIESVNNIIKLANKIRIVKISEYKNSQVKKDIYYNVDTGAELGQLIYQDGRPFDGIYYEHFDYYGHSSEPIKYIKGKTEKELEQEALEAKWEEERLKFEECIKNGNDQIFCNEQRNAHDKYPVND